MALPTRQRVTSAIGPKRTSVFAPQGKADKSPGHLAPLNPSPIPTEQTQRAYAGSEEWESGGKRRYRYRN